MHIFSDQYDTISKLYESFQHSCSVHLFAHYPIHMFSSTKSYCTLVVYKTLQGTITYPHPQSICLSRWFSGFPVRCAVDPESAIKFPQNPKKFGSGSAHLCVWIVKTMFSVLKFRQNWGGIYLLLENLTTIDRYFNPWFNLIFVVYNPRIPKSWKLSNGSLYI